VNQMEKMVWAAGFASAVFHERQTVPMGRIAGFGCAYYADMVLQKYRDALKHPDAKDLEINR
jgi:hypothetical protein